ncbi:MAG: 3-dehydroquinate synthase [Candidatus Omnitrophota bacterium]
MAEKTYSILTGENSLSHLPTLIKKTNLGHDAVVITTDKITSLHGKKLKSQLLKSCRHVLWLTVEDSEKSKSAHVALHLIEKITRFDIKKDIFLVAFGGGVIGDLTGFIAAIYKRGIPYIQIPTTLLAQVDSSIGGKTALDTKCGKNLIGAFYQPKFVLTEIAFLKTLPKKEILAGLAEIIKYALIKDKQLFAFLKKHILDIFGFKQKSLHHIIAACASIKAKIVSKDEYDKKGERIVLNFGHTVGHAIEAVSNFKINHGDAVSMGMIYACRLSRKKNLISEKDASEIIGFIRKIGLPSNMPKIQPEKIIKAMQFDKKVKKGKLRFVLIKKVGETKITEDLSREDILEALKQPL